MERWFAFEERDRARLAREWLASIDFPADDEAQPPSAPEPPRKPAVTPLRIAHVLLLGAPDGKTEVIGGRVRRWVDAKTEGDARRFLMGASRLLNNTWGGIAIGATGLQVGRMEG